jgi:hypothetical protein
MATFGELIKSTLAAAPAVTAIVNGRVFPNVIKQGVEMPAVRYMVVDDLPENVLGAAATLRRARVQVDAYSMRYLEAHALAEAIAGALGAIDGPDVTALELARRDGYEDETKLHRVSLDFSMSMEV